MALGDIWYSAKANRFYQEGRQGAVSNDIGARSLLHDPATEQYIDSRGRTVPSTIVDRQNFRARDLLAYDVEGRPFVASTVRSQVISEQAAALGNMQSNQTITVRTVVTLPDGTVHISYLPGKIGENVDPTIIRQQAAGKIRAELGKENNPTGKIWNIATNEIRIATKSTQFILQTTTIR